MKTKSLLVASLAISCTLAAAAPAGASTVFRFDNGLPDGKLGALSQPAGAGHIQTETTDDFVLTANTRLSNASFVGLLPTGVKRSDIKDVEIEFYHLFPGDGSRNPPSGAVNTRNNSPADFEIASATRDANAGSLSFTTDVLSDEFTATNSISTVHGTPEFTGGDGPVSGQEVRFNVSFDDQVLLGAGHLFFRPEVELANGNFFWLSSGVPVKPDLQAWMRNDALAPDWVRTGADVTHQGPFNMAFALRGEAGVPEPASWALMIAGFGLSGATMRWRRRHAAVAA